MQAHSQIGLILAGSKILAKYMICINGKEGRDSQPSYLRHIVLLRKAERRHSQHAAHPTHRGPRLMRWANMKDKLLPAEGCKQPRSLASLAALCSSSIDSDTCANPYSDDKTETGRWPYLQCGHLAEVAVDLVEEDVKSQLVHRVVVLLHQLLALRKHLRVCRQGRFGCGECMTAPRSLWWH